MKNKVALIFGIGGQDGGLLSKFLIKKGYLVHGTSRNINNNPFYILSDLGVKEHVNFHSISRNDFKSILKLIDYVRPDEIYNLSGQSSVGLSFQEPIETMDSIVNFTLNLLEVIRVLGIKTRFYQASSSEMFGNTHSPADEKTPLLPRSPYAVAKVAAHYCIVNYREAYDLYACSGILFNHESPYRSSRFVTQRIAESAVKIAHEQQENLYLGNINIKRDWGWAEEYVEAMWLMLQQDRPDDYVIATGATYPLIDFIRVCFQEFGLEADKFIKHDKGLCRPTDVLISMANPDRAKLKLKWIAKNKMEDVAKMMTQAALLRFYQNDQKTK